MYKTLDHMVTIRTAFTLIFSAALALVLVRLALMFQLCLLALPLALLNPDLPLL